jgi:hypothetical protein
MRTKIAFVTSFAALSLLTTGALAEEAPAPAPATAPIAPAAAPAAEASPAAAPPAEAAPAPAATTAEAAPAVEVAAAADAPAAMPGWMRIDSDGGGVQLWGGFTYPLTDGVGLAMDMYVFQGLLNNTLTSLGEFDIGPAITAGPLTLTPMIGLQIDWTSRKAQALVPQFYAVGSLGPIYTEFWFQYYLNSVFNEAPMGADVANQIYVRLIGDFKINDYVAAGLELDLAHDSEGLDREGQDAKLRSLAIGPNVMFSNAGAGSSFMIFLGYETKKFYANGGGLAVNDDSANHLTGRLTFVHNF